MFYRKLNFYFNWYIYFSLGPYLVISLISIWTCSIKYFTKIGITEIKVGFLIENFTKHMKKGGLLGNVPDVVIQFCVEDF